MVTGASDGVSSGQIVGDEASSFGPAYIISLERGSGGGRAGSGKRGRHACTALGISACVLFSIVGGGLPLEVASRTIGRRLGTWGLPLPAVSGRHPRRGGHPHAAWACMNAGDCGSSPARLTEVPPLLRNVGSGKLGTPCLRMHSALASAARRSLSEAGDPLGCGLLVSLSQLRPADRNAGACVLIPEPWPPTGEPGSGKLGTPCDRMQSANLSASASPLPVAAALLGLSESPQALSAKTKLTLTSAAGRRR